MLLSPQTTARCGEASRANGLITPCRPISIEAAAGKNSATHTGRIFTVLAQWIAAAIANAVPGVDAAQCIIVGHIGDWMDRPSVLHLKVARAHDHPDTPPRAYCA